MWLTLLLAAAPAVLAAPPEGPPSRPADWAQPVAASGPRNFYRVSPDVYRSEQPTEGEMAVLAAMGIRSLLNLREFHSDDDEAERIPLRLYRVPMDAGEIREEQVVEAVRVLRDCPKPVLVHCWHGSDRTGCVVAIYRMVFQGWPREKAVAEFKDGGYGYHESIYPNIERFLRTVDVEALRKIAASAKKMGSE